MRIVSGEFGGRRLKAVPGMKTRPTTDKVKESIFNMIGPYFSGGTALDLYGGSGGLAIESVSRGMDHAVIIDRQYQAIKTITDNVAVTKQPEKFEIKKGDSNQIIDHMDSSKTKFNLLLLDPPYKQQKIVKDINKLVELNLLADDAVIVCETNQEAKLPDEIDNFKLWKRQDYGITEVSIYRGE
ncbi:16S rRNA (guanine(966)-N(2))-methyltransferase RsmD [Pediococcus argentinicus]|uniref:16S rRNA (guanine(966)-N(2))-methyltransferase RsmD n=1 Tax=Pediococcus argentinicus TaxID=480391 RepID=UPI00338F5E38